MTTKGILRFLIGFCIAVALLSIAAPFANIPRSQLFPPPLVYLSAKGKAQGVITARRDLPTSAWFRQGDRDYSVEYRFSAPAPLMLGGPPHETITPYTGTVGVDANTYGTTKEGQVVSVRYDPTYPAISGIDTAWGGRSTASGSGFLSGWLFWLVGAVVLGYIISPLIERVALRESY